MRQCALTILAPLRVNIEQLELKKNTVRWLGQVLEGREELTGPAKTEATSASFDAPEPHLNEANEGQNEQSAHTSDYRAVARRAPELVPELSKLVAKAAIHYMSVFVIDRDEAGLAYVGLELNADGSVQEWRHLLATCAPTFLRHLFEECDRFDPNGDTRSLNEFIARNTRRPDVYFVAYPGRTVCQIRGEHDLRMAARKHLEGPLRPWLHPTLRPPRPASPRAAPTSASAIWGHIRDAFANDPLVRDGATRPFSVRWSLAMGGLTSQLNLLGKRVFWTLLVATAAAWFATSAWAPPVAAAAFGITGAIVLAAWCREAPRALRGNGRWVVVRRALWTWLASGAAFSVGLGAAAMVVRLGVHVAKQMPNYPSVVGLAVVVSGVVAATLSRLGLRATVSGAILLALIDVALVLPVDSLPRLLSALVTSIGVLLVLPLAAFCYVMADVMAALVLAAALWGGWLLLATHFRDAPIALALIGCGATAMVSLIGFGWLAMWLSAVRYAEEHDNASTPQTRMPNVGHLAKVEEREDQTLQNHLIVVSCLKDHDQALRLRTMRRVLRAVALLVKVYANRGDLGGIRTIHFAQFILLEESTPKRLILLSNYDSAFGAYLQEFNQVAGVTALWSNCVGFPPAFGLVSDGAADEQRFKQFGRRYQVPTLGWYSAYPSLFIGDIETATATRENLRRRLDDPSTWRGRMRALFGQPLSEVDCDAALRRL